MSEYNKNTSLQIIYSSSGIEDYLKKGTGKSFKLQKPLLGVSETRIQAKFRMKGSKYTGYLTPPMFVLELDYDIGFDEYRVKTSFWHDLSTGKPVFEWDSNGVMPLESVFNPSFIFGSMINKVKDYLSKKIDNKASAINDIEKRASAGKKKVEIRMPLFLVSKKGEPAKQKYAIYIGYEEPMDDEGRRLGILREFILTGKNGNSYWMHMKKDGKYYLYSYKNRKLLASGTLNDRYAPEIIQR